MSVKLIAKTVGVNDDSLENLIVYCGRVSNPKSQERGLNNESLIKYLIRNNHWSPFEMASIILEIKTTRDIARQILRHRSFSFQEFSQRYAEVVDFASEREARLQDTKNRQNSLPTSDLNLKHDWALKQIKVMEAANEAYTWAIDNDIAKECARAVLPEGLTPSVLYMSGTVRSWIHYLKVRLDESTQKEHREIAKQCLEVLKKECPMIFTDELFSKKCKGKCAIK